MITISNFGWRLGNQMLQIAAAYTLAKENNDEFLCPKWDYQKYFKFKHKLYQGEEVENNYKEVGFHYNKIPYSLNLSLEGYFQSYKYSTPEILQELFEFENNFTFNIKLTGQLTNVGGESGTCSIHVRRGDYLKYPDHHPLCKEEYYIHAVHVMSTKYGIKNFLVCSDDIVWCKDFFKNTDGAKFLFSECDSDMADFAFMKNCNHNIISNSTFSLMAAMLNKNPNKVVISPSKDNWHGTAYADWNHDDLIPKDYIQITF